MQNLKILDFLFYLIILLPPSYLVKISILSIKINLLDLMLVLFIFWWLYSKYKNWDKKELLDSLLGIKQYLAPIILIIVGISIATARSTDILASLGILKSWFVLPILFFIASSDIIKSNNQKINILKVWVWSGFSVAVVSLFYYFSGYVTYDGRLEAFFQSPNHLAMFLAPAFIGSVFILINGEARKGVFWSVFVVFIGVTIFLTKSLGGILAIVVSFLPFFYRQIKSSKNKITTFFILAFLVFSLLFLVLGKNFSDRSSLSSRFMIWSSATEILKDNAIFGIGPGTFQKEYLIYQKHFKPYLEWAVPHPHNVFLAFWLQTGIIGFAGFLWLLLIFFKGILADKKNKISILAGSLMIYILAHGLVDETYWKNDLALIFWLTILLSLKTENNK